MQPPEVVFFKKEFLIMFAKFTKKHLHQSFFFNKMTRCFWHRCFPVHFGNFLTLEHLFIQHIRTTASEVKFKDRVQDLKSLPLPLYQRCVGKQNR